MLILSALSVLWLASLVLCAEDYYRVSLIARIMSAPGEGIVGSDRGGFISYWASTSRPQTRTSSVHIER